VLNNSWLFQQSSGKDFAYKTETHERDAVSYNMT